MKNNSGNFPLRSFICCFSPNILCCIALLYIASHVGCRRPDQAGPEDNWCTSGTSVLTVNDATVPADVKARIYGPAPGYHSVGTESYNANPPVVIIPYQYSTILPFNSTVTTSVIRENFFETGNGSVRDYFSENSWGQYNIREKFIANVSMLSQDTTFYQTATERDWTSNPNHTRDICQNSNVNWALLDANGDNTITQKEALIVILGAFGASGACRPSTVHITTGSGKEDYTITGGFVVIGCKKNDDPTKGTDDISYNYSNIWHEMSHAMFNLPDRYTGYSGDGPTGNYDPMCSPHSRKHLSIYDKMKIGWIQPRILVKVSDRPDRARHCFSFPAVEAVPAALILWDASQPKEYWIVENRFKDGSPRNFEGGLPESGLAIWWVGEVKDSLYLVDARNTYIRPHRTLYSSGDAQQGALFCNRTGTRDSTFSLQFVQAGNGNPTFAIRAPSPIGQIMYAEF